MNFPLALFVLVVVTIHGITSKGQICEPGSVFMDECNKCVCSSNGMDKACTKINCVSVSPHMKQDTIPGNTMPDLTEEDTEEMSNTTLNVTEK